MRPVVTEKLRSLAAIAVLALIVIACSTDPLPPDGAETSSQDTSSDTTFPDVETDTSSPDDVSAPDDTTVDTREPADIVSDEMDTDAEDAEVPTLPSLSETQPDGNFQPQEIVLIDLEGADVIGAIGSVRIGDMALDAIVVDSGLVAFVVPTMEPGVYSLTGEITELGFESQIAVENFVDVVAQDGRTPTEIVRAFRAEQALQVMDLLSAESSLPEEFPDWAEQLQNELTGLMDVPPEFVSATEREQEEGARYLLLNDLPVEELKLDLDGCFDVETFVRDQLVRITKATMLTLAASLVSGPVGVVVGVAAFGYVAYKVYERHEDYIRDCFDHLIELDEFDLKMDDDVRFQVPADEEVRVIPSLSSILESPDAADVFSRFRALIARQGTMAPGDFISAWSGIPTESFHPAPTRYDAFAVAGVDPPIVQIDLLASADELYATFTTTAEIPLEGLDFTFELAYRAIACEGDICVPEEAEFRLVVPATLYEICGNGIVDTDLGEECDPRAEGVGSTCAIELPGTAGELQCNDDCTFDLFSCSCGEAGEPCCSDGRGLCGDAYDGLGCSDGSCADVGSAGIMASGDFDSALYDSTGALVSEGIWVVPALLVDAGSYRVDVTYLYDRDGCPAGSEYSETMTLTCGTCIRLWPAASGCGFLVDPFTDSCSATCP